MFSWLVSWTEENVDDTIKEIELKECEKEERYSAIPRTLYFNYTEYLRPQ
jgi:hypothetical protein